MLFFSFSLVSPLLAADLPFAGLPVIGTTNFNSSFSGSGITLAGPTPGTTITASNVGSTPLGIAATGWDFTLVQTSGGNPEIAVGTGQGGFGNLDIRMISNGGPNGVGQVNVKSTNGSAFKLQTFSLEVISGFGATHVTVTGFRSSVAVTGAVSTANFTSANWATFSVTSNTAFADVDEFRISFTGTTITSTAVDNISIANPVISLPLILTSFSGQRSGDDVLLGWTTSSEENTKDFTIERSSDGVGYVSVGQTAAAGNSESLLTYHYTDALPSTNASQYFYRLQLVDLDGNFTYSPIVRIGGPSSATALSVYPNPCKQQVNIAITSPGTDNAFISVTDLAGRTLSIQSMAIQAGNNVLTLSSMSALPKGIYLLSVLTKSGRQVVQVSKTE